MQWTSATDWEFKELMDDYALIEPALERACRFEDALERLEREVAVLRAERKPE